MSAIIVVKGFEVDQPRYMYSFIRYYRESSQQDEGKKKRAIQVTMRGKCEPLVRNKGSKYRHRLYKKWLDGRNYCLKLRYVEA